MPSRSRGIRILLTLFVIAIVGGTAGLGVVYFTLLRDLPEMKDVTEVPTRGLSDTAKETAAG